ncbi:hypothetical protein D3C85_1402340 [compost metagenome]
MSQEAGLSSQLRRDAATGQIGHIIEVRHHLISSCEYGPQRHNRFWCAGFVDGYTNAQLIKDTQVNASLFGISQYFGGGLRGDDTKSVEEIVLLNLMTEIFKAFSQNRGQPMNAVGNIFQSFRAMVNRVRTCNIGQ